MLVDCILDGKFWTKDSNIVASVTILHTFDHGRCLQMLSIPVVCIYCSCFDLYEVIPIKLHSQFIITVFILAALHCSGMLLMRMKSQQYWQLVTSPNNRDDLKRSNLHQTDLVFGLWLDFICSSMHAGWFVPPPFPWLTDRLIHCSFLQLFIYFSVSLACRAKSLQSLIIILRSGQRIPAIQRDIQKRWTIQYDDSSSIYSTCND